MTCVSDVKLAIACAKAGVVPSLSTAPTNINIPRLQNDIQAFKKAMGHCNLILGMVSPDDSLEFENLIVQLVKKYGISHVEYIQMAYSRDFVNRINDLNCKVIIKHGRTNTLKVKCDAITLKGSEAAGYSSTVPLKEIFLEQLQKTRTPLIPCGGIATKEQIDYYMNNGALAVSIGTLFAASEESRVAKATKLEMIRRTSADISFLADTNNRGLIYRNERDDLSHSLEQGVQGNILNAHIFVGSGIDKVEEILPVREIVNRLTYR